ncbi:Sulfotransferase 1C4 [Amphibalanus amphitrite]|uniref:Sulfotransferase 1C4 n=1 Tax=Amphibalanus amphitrite TaxID=1232801 RepID=A0A6A4VBL1_AMPAM|nr:Sulfotransferase 1C4 [Amphibalanus amphitrite]
MTREAMHTFHRVLAKVGEDAVGLPLSAFDLQSFVLPLAKVYSDGRSVLDWDFKVAGTATAADFAAHLNQPLRRGDVWVCSPPKCGSMWTQELVWLLENQLDFDGCRAMLTDRWRFGESRFAADLEERARIAAARPATAPVPDPAAARSRFVKSHLPLSLSPPRLLDTCKVVYLARNPKDICVSFFNPRSPLQDGQLRR